MSIVGITGEKRNYFPRLGKIRLGVKRQGQGGSEFPQDVDYFVIEELPEVQKVYGQTPKEIVVLFPSNSQQEIFPMRLEAWRASKTKGPDGKPKSKLWCNSTDGEVATRIYVGDKDAQGHAVVMRMPEDERPDPGEIFTMPCPNEECPHYQNSACKGVARLNVVLPEVSISGIYQIETGSQFGRGNILDMLNWTRNMTGGQFAWKVPFLLTREATNVTHDGKSFVKYMLTLRVIDDEERLRRVQIKIPSWLKAKSLLTIDAPAERPEDLFPEGRTRAALPAAPEEPSAPDPLYAKATAAGLTVAQLEMLKARMRGDVALIERELDTLIARKKAPVATPLPAAPALGGPLPSAPPQSRPPAAPKQQTLITGPPDVDEPPHTADDPLLGF
jgi:recombination directionality factor gp3-like protein